MSETSPQYCFAQAFDLALRGYKVRATEWNKEYFLSFNGINILFTSASQTNHIIDLVQLNIWRQVYTKWELYK